MTYRSNPNAPNACKIPGCLTCLDHTTETPVVFRRYPDGDIIALFPTLKEQNFLCQSYLHVGQHGAADYGIVISQTKPATKKEYAELKKELESKPYEYRLKVYKRRPAQT